MNKSNLLVHAGVAGLLAAAAVTAVATVSSLAAGSGTRSVYVPIAPCRLADTRADSTVGGRGTPLGVGETHTFQVWGTNVGVRVIHRGAGQVIPQLVPVSF